ncbi:Follistatin, putative [Gryllus bimaculatus]|nr:Follistatin, putative [Gryllus bimaculatus]
MTKALKLKRRARALACAGGNCWSLRVRSNGRCTELLGREGDARGVLPVASVATAWSSEDLDSARSSSGACWVACPAAPARLCRADTSCEPEYKKIVRGYFVLVDLPIGIGCLMSSQPLGVAWRPRSPACAKTRVRVCCAQSRARAWSAEGRRCEVRQGSRAACAARLSRGRAGGGGAAAARAAAAGGRAAPRPCAARRRTYARCAACAKRACRRKTQALTVAYDGHCQSSCERLRCPAGKHCLLDQNLRPHCVKCAARRCPRRGHAVCGADGVTYASSCHLRGAACLRGRAIPEAYRGPCKPAGAAVSCGAVRCRERQACLLEPATGAPRCVTCSYRCPKGSDLGGPICGSNNLTYPSWCHMLKDACDTGYVIETRFAGRCDRPADAQRAHLPPALNCSSSSSSNSNSAAVAAAATGAVANAIPGLSNSVVSADAGGPGSDVDDDVDAGLEPCAPPTLA